ncbi:hypothetical protein [Chryseobacterium sp. SIMBA_029]|uniref:hypothetical protein n=1 Tax=Chryseobacterium sp. SIMBA_029 TaxID=3085772 RepID=UPI00397D6691
MVETQIYISVNRKADIDVIKTILIRNKIESPVYITEFGENFGINFTSSYEEWELDKLISETFPGYEFVTDLNRGRKEIRLEISRYQSELCTTKWGNPIDNPLNQTRYLIKKSLEVPIRFNPEIKVLFGSDEKSYHINIIPGINSSTQEKGFLLLDDFKQKADPETTDFFPDKLYKTQLDAFYRGKDKLESIVATDFMEFLGLKKREKQQCEKIPRKIIREFVNSCNNYDYDSILKDLSPNIEFEIRVNWQQKFVTEGIEDLKKYIRSSHQQICGRHFKIKSPWTFHQKDISISLHTSTPPSETEEVPKNFYRIQLNFRMEEQKINQIIFEI